MNPITWGFEVTHLQLRRDFAKFRSSSSFKLRILVFFLTPKRHPEKPLDQEKNLLVYT